MLWALKMSSTITCLVGYQHAHQKRTCCCLHHSNDSRHFTDPPLKTCLTLEQYVHFTFVKSSKCSALQNVAELKVCYNPKIMLLSPHRLRKQNDKFFFYFEDNWHWRFVATCLNSWHDCRDIRSGCSCSSEVWVWKLHFHAVQRMNLGTQPRPSAMLDKICS